LLYYQAEKQKPKSPSQKTNFFHQSVVSVVTFFSLNRGYFELKQKIISFRSPHQRRKNERAATHGCSEKDEKNEAAPEET